MREPDRLPSHAAMAWPVLVAIKRAGGSATNAEVMAAVANYLHLTDKQRAITRTPKSSRTLLDYRLAWSRTLLKNMGAIQNDGPCLWSLTDAGGQVTQYDIQKFVKGMLSRLEMARKAK
jgi:restriction system protein